MAWASQDAELAAEQAALEALPDGLTAPDAMELWDPPTDLDCGPPDGPSAWLADLPGELLDEYAEATAEPTGPEVLEAGFWDRSQGDGAGFASGGVCDKLAPGPVLAGLVNDARTDGLTRLSDDELIGVLIAARKLSSWSTALELAAVSDLQRRREDEAAMTGDSKIAEHVLDEVAAALTLTVRSADCLVDLAASLAKLPGTFAALESGLIDRQKAVVIADETQSLTPAHRAAVEQQVLRNAPAQTTAKLRAATRCAVIAADPAAARKRREKAQRDARVERWEEPGGTGALAGRDLPPGWVLAADHNVSALARALKAAGLAGTMDQLRGQAFLMLLTGQPIDSLLSIVGNKTSAPQGSDRADMAPSAPGTPNTTPNTADTPGGPKTAGPPGAPGTASAAERMVGSGTGDTNGSARPGISTSSPGSLGRNLPAAPGLGLSGASGLSFRGTAGVGFPGTAGVGFPGTAGVGFPGTAGVGFPGTAGVGFPGTAGVGFPGTAGVGFPGTAGVGFPGTAGVGFPGTAGVGFPGTAGVGLPGSAGQRVSAAAGMALSGGTAGGAGVTAGGAGVAGLAGMINLTVPFATWLGLSDASGEAAGFGPLDSYDSRDLAAVLAKHPLTRWCVTLTDSHGQPLAHGCARKGAGPPPGPGSGPSPGANLSAQARAWMAGITLAWLESGACTHERESSAYRPSPSLQHLIRVRQRTCSHPGCRRPATRCDLDHTIPYDKGGRTCECNMAPLCRRHHRTKQTHGWQLEQPRPGVLTWRTPSGRTYTTRPTTYGVA